MKIASAILPAVLSLAVGAVAQEKQPLRLVQTIPLPDVKGRIDHLAVDVKGNRLFVAGLENKTVEVVDLREGKGAQSLTGFAKPQGVFYVPAVDKLFVADGNEGTVKIIDGKTLKPVGSVSVSLGADLVDYDARAKQLYVGHGGKDAGKDYGEISLIDVVAGKKALDIRTGAH